MVRPTTTCTSKSRARTTATVMLTGMATRARVVAMVANRS